MAGVRDYLQLFRAQTAAVEGAGFPLAAWIGGAPLWSLPLFALYGILAHFGGFGENSFSDLSYDRADPSKADHPLVSGRMTPAEAIAGVYGSQAAAFVLFFALLQYSSHLAVLPLAAFLGYQALGHAYNYLGKMNKPAAVLEISGAFALGFLAAGSSWHGSASAVVWVVTLYAFLMTAYQIAVAGELKEIAQSNERNLLRRMGSRVGPGMLGALSPHLAAAHEESVRTTGDDRPWFWPGRWAFWTGFLLSLAKATALTFVAWLVAGNWGLVVWPLAFASLEAYNLLLLRPGPFDRPRRIRTMGLGEAGSYLLLVLALAPSLWPLLLVAFLVLPVIWFASMNRILWSRTGSAWAPGV